MNQILAVENKKKEKVKTKKIRTGRPIEIKGIVMFFAVIIMVFGLTLAGQGSYALYKDIDDRKPENIPYVTIGRVNDKAIVQISSNIEISKLVYSWNNGEESAIPIGSTNAREEITLLGYDSVLNLTIEDMNGKRVKFQKQYLLTGVDITKPVVEIETKDGNDKMKIVAKDETGIAYITYQWEDGEPVTVNADQQGQTEMIVQVPLTVGLKKIKIIAVDTNGNIEEIEREITTSTSRPKMTLRRNKQKISIEIEDKDGIKSIKANLNGEEYEITNVNRKKVKVGYLYLREGNNTISVEVTNVNDYTEKATAELQYNP
ncbi:unknown [Clostridium sp. CAG:508]|jgi:hypothetical protein|nr:unknown [Clostridium sp. CAG:508]DAK87753.1 MAG TPA: hypothetical protein [Bacteriophage sp.]